MIKPGNSVVQSVEHATTAQGFFQSEDTSGVVENKMLGNE